MSIPDSWFPTTLGPFFARPASTHRQPSPLLSPLISPFNFFKRVNGAYFSHSPAYYPSPPLVPPDRDHSTCFLNLLVKVTIFWLSRKLSRPPLSHRPNFSFFFLTLNIWTPHAQRLSFSGGQTFFFCPGASFSRDFSGSPSVAPQTSAAHSYLRFKA